MESEIRYVYLNFNPEQIKMTHTHTQTKQKVTLENVENKLAKYRERIAMTVEAK